MANPSRPDFVRRHLRRGWWFFAVTSAVAGIGLFADRVFAANEVTDDLVDGQPSEATVDVSYTGGEAIPVRYEHPIFGPVEAWLQPESLEPRLRAEQTVAIVASRIDPADVALPGDHHPRAAPDWAFAVPPAVVLAFALHRRRRVRRVERGITDTDPPAHHLAQLRRRRRVSSKIVADLYPLEATVGARPLCSVPLISSGGLPVGGAAFPVQVRMASPFSASSSADLRPLRWIDVRTDDEVLWPSRRALGPRVVPWPDRARQRRFRGSIAPVPEPGLSQDLPPGRRSIGWSIWLGSVTFLGVGLGILVLTLVTTSRGQRRAEHFAREGVEVPAEIAAIDEPEERVTISFRLPGQERLVETTVPVTFPEDWYVGQKRLAVVDPDDTAEALLLGDLYDASVPVFLAAVTVVPGAVWFPMQLLLTLRLRRVSSGPWYEAEVVDGGRIALRPPMMTGLKLSVGRPGATSASCVVVVAVKGAEQQLWALARQQTYDAGWWQASQPTRPPEPGALPNVPFPPQDSSLPYQTFQVAPKTYAGPVLVAGILAPGEAVVLRIGDVVIPAIRRAIAPRPIHFVTSEESGMAALTVPPVPRSV